MADLGAQSYIFIYVLNTSFSHLNHIKPFFLFIKMYSTNLD